MSSQQYESIIRRWVEEAWNNGNFARAKQDYAPGYVMHDPGGPVAGAEALTQFIAAYRLGIPDLRFDVEDVIAQGDKVAWRFVVRGTHQGDLFGIPPTGKAVTCTGIVITRFAGGLWAEDWVNYDLFGMMQQIGVIPAAA